MFGCGTFALGTFCLLFSGQALALGAGSPLLRLERGLLGASTSGGRFISMRRDRGTTLRDLRSATAPRGQDGDDEGRNRHDDDDRDESSGYEEWHVLSP